MQDQDRLLHIVSLLRKRHPRASTKEIVEMAKKLEERLNREGSMPRARGQETDTAFQKEDRTQSDTGYGKALRVSRGINRIMNAVDMPAKLTTEALLNDEEKKNQIMNTIRGIQSATSAPVLQEKVRAGASALKNAPAGERKGVGKEVMKEVGKEGLMQALPLLQEAAEQYF